MLNVKVGDEVIVSKGGPRGGRYPATVTSVRRKLFTIRCAASWLDGDYRLDNGRLNSGEHYGYGPPRVVTLEQQKLQDRRSDAVAVLEQHHIRLDPQNKLTLEQIEALAQVARTFSADAPEEG